MAPINNLLKTLDEGKLYYRELSVNGNKYKHKEHSKCECGFYINGIEFFKNGNFYWLKTWTTWDGIVCINSIFKVNKKGELLKFYLNTFGLSKGKCVLWENNKEAKEDFREWIGLINECLDSEDEERKVIVKHNPQFK